MKKRQIALGSGCWRGRRFIGFIARNPVFWVGDNVAPVQRYFACEKFSYNTKTAYIKGSDQKMQMHKLVCAFELRMQQNHGFL